MKIDTMRFIDRWAGIPLCFAGTVIQRIFCRPHKNITPKNVLFIELSEMGSAILADPAMRKLRDNHGAKLHFLIFEKNKPSLELLGTVEDENIFVIRPDIKHLLVDTLRFLIWARKKQIDTVIDIELFSRYTALLAGFCGADNIVGFYRYYNEGLYRGEMLTRRVSYNHYMHISKNFIALVNSLYEDTGGNPYSKLPVDDSDITLAKAEITCDELDRAYAAIDDAAPGWRSHAPRILLVNPNASDLLPQRRWPKEQFAECVRLMLDRYKDITVLLTGAKGEYDLAECIRTAVDSDRCVNFTGRLKLRDMLALYSVSCAMLTNDSGPGHFSAVTDLPTVVLFGPETPALYGSLGHSIPMFLGLACSPCVSASNHRKTTCVDNLCLKKITPESVAVVLSGILDKQ